MGTQPLNPDALPEVPLDKWGLPDVPFRGEPISVSHFRVLLHAARTMKTVGKLTELEPIFAGGEVVEEVRPNGDVRTRAARRRSFHRWLSEHPALAELLESEINLRRAEVLSRLECQALRIALSDGDTTTEYDPKSGAVKRVRKDMRNASYATLWLLQRLDKERFGDSKRLEVDGQVSHEHKHAHAHLAIGGGSAGGYLVDFQSVREALTEEESRLMLSFLERIEDVRTKRRAPALPKGNHDEQ